MCDTKILKDSNPINIVQGERGFAVSASAKILILGISDSLKTILHHPNEMNRNDMICSFIPSHFTEVKLSLGNKMITYFGLKHNRQYIQKVAMEMYVNFLEI